MDLYSDKIYPNLKCCVCYEPFKIYYENNNSISHEEVFKCKICNEGIYCHNCFLEVCDFNCKRKSGYCNKDLYKYINIQPCAICKSNLLNTMLNNSLTELFQWFPDCDYDLFKCALIGRDHKLKKYESKPVFKILYNNLKSNVN